MQKVTEKTDKFLWLGNDPAIDFVNTAIVSDGKPVDLLQGPDDYLAWLNQAGLELRFTDKGRQQLKAGYQHAREFRDKLRDALDRLARGATIPTRALEATNALLSRGGPSGQLEARGGSFELRPFWEVREAADYVSPIAGSFAEFIAKSDLQRLKKCKNPECVLFFYDTSKSGTRSWCSLDICGNKLRMAASRERHKQ